MKQLLVGQAIESSRKLASFSQQVRGQVDRGQVLKVPSSQLTAYVIKAADNFLEACVSLDFVVSAPIVNRIGQKLRETTTTHEHFPTSGKVEEFSNFSLLTLQELNSLFTGLTHALQSESPTKLAFTLSAAKSALYDPPSPLFEQAVNSKFPSAAFEIEEAGKCLALGRPTAAVFHLMRVMEIGLRAVNACLGGAIPSGQGQSWGSLLNAINSACKARGKNWTDSEFFSEVYAQVNSVKDAWRNTTMHVENRYTDEEAKTIFLAVKGFMVKLAKRMDESGNPKAP